MPKIIENPEHRLMDEARKQIAASGYSAMTVRSVAKACGIAVGTVYNYFPSKDDLVAAYLLEDWKHCVADIHTVSQESADPAPVVQRIHRQLMSYSRRNEAVFRDAAAVSGFSGSFSRYHGLLRSQLAAPLRKFCPDDFTAEFIAESLLTWTMAGRELDEIYGIIRKLF